MRISDWSSDVCSSDLTVRNTGGDTGNTSDSNVLQARLNAALEQLRDRDGTIDDLRHRLDRSDEERREAQARVIGLLAGPGPTESKRGFFGRLFGRPDRSEEHKSELQSLMRISYAVFCLKQKKKMNSIVHQR